MTEAPADDGEEIAIALDGVDCQACGACCTFSAEWPRFSLETDAEIDAIPSQYVATSGMRCVGNRCSALVGEVGKATACGVYPVRPQVCRACVPGGDDCRMARERHGLPALN